MRGAARSGSGCRRRSGRSKRWPGCSSATGRCPRSSTAATSARSTSRSSCPEGELEAVTSAEQMADVLDRIADLVREHRTTLVFVNTRRLGRTARAPARRAARRRRRRRAPRQPLEGSPLPRRDAAARRRAAGAGGNRIARARHRHRAGRARVPDRLAPQHRDLPAARRPFEPLACRRARRAGCTRSTRDELVECAALLAAVRAGQLDAIALPRRRSTSSPSRSSPRSRAQEWATDDALRDVAPRRAVQRRSRARSSTRCSSSPRTASRPVAGRAAGTCTTTRSTARCAAARARGSPR